MNAQTFEGELDSVVCNAEEQSLSSPPLRSALELYNSPPDPSDTLIGDRFLCRGGGLVIAAPSGVGKSTLVAGLSVAFAKGESYLGLEPARALKLLVIQSENDDGDLYEQLRGAQGELMEGDEATLQANIMFATVDHLSGAPFLQALRHYLQQFPADIVFIDCFNAYLGDSPAETKAVSSFLRCGLTPILRQFGCGAVLVHHTPKTTNQKKEGWNASDRQYAMAGASEIQNWMRSGVMIESTIEADLFRLVAVKKGNRLGWSESCGGAPSKLIRHAKSKSNAPASLRWEFADSADVERLKAAREKHADKDCSKPDETQLLSIFPMDFGDDPRNGLLNSNQVKDAFEKAGWPMSSYKNELERLKGTGLIDSTKGRKANEVLHGRQHAIAAFNNQSSSSVLNPNKPDWIAGKKHGSS